MSPRYNQLLMGRGFNSPIEKVSGSTPRVHEQSPPRYPCGAENYGGINKVTRMVYTYFCIFYRLCSSSPAISLMIKGVPKFTIPP